MSAAMSLGGSPATAANAVSAATNLALTSAGSSDSNTPHNFLTGSTTTQNAVAWGDVSLSLSPPQAPSNSGTTPMRSVTARRARMAGLLRSGNRIIVENGAPLLGAPLHEDVANRLAIGLTLRGLHHQPREKAIDFLGSVVIGLDESLPVLWILGDDLVDDCLEFTAF